MTIKKMTRISLFTALICVCTVVIPPISIAGIPFTLQTLMIMLTAAMLKPSEAFISVLMYLVIGIIGIPVFSGYSSGLSVILGPTGGFLISFPFAAYLMSLFNKKAPIFRLLIINIILGIIFVYILGIAFISIYTNKTYIDVAISMLIFIPIDLGKAIIAAIVANKMQNLPIMLDD